MAANAVGIRYRPFGFLYRCRGGGGDATWWWAIDDVKVTAEVAASGERFIRGDVNQDGGVNIAGPISVLGHLFGRNPAPACPDTADGNNDGTINIADPIRILGYLFGGAGDLPPPASACGYDEVDDALAACAYDRCP